MYPLYRTNRYGGYFFISDQSKRRKKHVHFVQYAKRNNAKKKKHKKCIFIKTQTQYIENVKEI